MGLIRVRARAIGQVAFTAGGKGRRRWVQIGEEFDCEEQAFSQWMERVPAKSKAAAEAEPKGKKPVKPAKDAPVAEDIEPKVAESPI